MSCWPLVCASAKKPSHKGLNIDKLTSRPVIKTNKAAESQGWISWLLGIDLSFGHEEEMQDEEEAAQDLNDAQEDEEEYEELEVISSFKYEDLTKEEETASYEVILDRAKAITTAIKKLTCDETLVIIGKGHEDYQIIGNKRFQFSDEEEVNKCIT